MPEINSGLRTIAFIDAGQFRPSVVANRLDLQNGQRFDWQKFCEFLASVSGAPLLDAHYFDSIETESADRQVNFHSFLRNQLALQLHFTSLKEKLRTCPSCGEQNREVEQKGVDVNISISMLKLAYGHAYDQALLCTGDGDFTTLVNFLRDSLGKRVVVLGWDNGIAPSLRDASYSTIVLNNYSEQFIGQRQR